MMRLQGKKAVVIGGSRGIGRAIATGLAKEGCDIALSYAHNLDAATETVSHIETAFHRKAKAIPLNLEVFDNFHAFVDEAANFLGSIDIVINNAGIVARTPFLEIEQVELDRIMNLNFKGVFLLTQSFARKMKEQMMGGTIINISSISSAIASIGLTHYQASKAALTNFTKGIALELAQYNIRVNSISPGLTATDMNKNQWENNTNIWKARVADIPLQKAGKPDDLVGAAIFLASDEASWVTGSDFIIDGGRSIF